MTEPEWLKCVEPKKMLEFLGGKASGRKLRLFACACCRRAWSLMTDERSRNGVLVRERIEDGLATPKELASASDAACWARSLLRQPFRFAPDLRENSPQLSPAYAAGAASNTAAGNHHPVSFYVSRAIGCLSDQSWDEALIAEETAHCSLLRDIVGCLPFRPVTVNPAWRTSTVVSLATAIYDERAFDRLPIFADALEDAGCDNADILNHCRQPGAHVRGCWALDLILAKE